MKLNMVRKLSLFLALLTVLVSLAGCAETDLSGLFSGLGGNHSLGAVTTPATQRPSTTTGKGPDQADPQQKIAFFMINDNHGVFVSENGDPGVERMATLLEHLDTMNGEHIRIANGDIFQGTYVSSSLRGRPMVDALNEMEFDAFVIGNHEFDWGLEEIEKYKDGDASNGEAEFPFLGANIYNKTTGERPDWIEPYTIVESNGIKVGIIGVMGMGLESSILTSKVENYEFRDYVPMVAEYAAELRTKGCELVVVAAHEYEESNNNRLADLSGQAAVDVIFCAHTHSKVFENVTRADGVKIPVMQNYGNGGTASELILRVNSDGTVAGYSGLHHTVKNSIQSTDMYNNVVKNYADVIAASKEYLGDTSERMSKGYLGEIACDAMCALFGADVGVMNTGGVRDTISAGSVTAADVFSVFPFENVVVTVRMTGAQIVDFFNRSGDFLYFNSTFNPSAFEADKTYTMAVIDYVFEGPYYQYAFGGSDHTYSNTVMRGVLSDYLKNTVLKKAA